MHLRGVEDVVTDAIKTLDDYHLKHREMIMRSLIDKKHFQGEGYVKKVKELNEVKDKVVDYIDRLMGDLERGNDGVYYLKELSSKLREFKLLLKGF